MKTNLISACLKILPLAVMLAGAAPAVAALREAVLLPLLYPNLYENLNVSPPAGVLLTGPPGTGKTHAVRALVRAAARAAAKSSNSEEGGSSNGNGGETTMKPLALFARRGADCLGKFAGDAERTLRLLFDEASRHAPSLVFIDELDG